MLQLLLLLLFYNDDDDSDDDCLVSFPFFYFTSGIAPPLGVVVSLGCFHDSNSNKKPIIKANAEQLNEPPSQNCDVAFYFFLNGGCSAVAPIQKKILFKITHF